MRIIPSTESPYTQSKIAKKCSQRIERLRFILLKLIKWVKSNLKHFIVNRKTVKINNWVNAQVIVLHDIFYMRFIRYHISWLWQGNNSILQTLFLSFSRSHCTQSYKSPCQQCNSFLWYIKSIRCIRICNG